MTGCLGYFTVFSNSSSIAGLTFSQVISGCYVVCAREKFRNKFWTNCCKIGIQTICNVPCFSHVNYFGTVGLLTNQLFNNFPSIPLVTRCFSYLSLIKIGFGQLDFFAYQISQSPIGFPVPRSCFPLLLSF